MIKEIFRGKYFDSDLVDETLEVIPTDELEFFISSTAGAPVFSKSEAMEMRDELEKILELAK